MGSKDNVLKVHCLHFSVVFRSLLGLLGVNRFGRLSSATEQGLGLERSLVSIASAAENVDLDDLALVKVLQRHDALKNKGVRVLHVQVQESHHGDTLVNTFKRRRDLLKIVGLDGGGDLLRRSLAERGARLLVSESSQVVLLVDHVLRVSVGKEHNNARRNITKTNNSDDLGVLEVKLAAETVDGKHDNQVRDHRIHFGRFWRLKLRKKMQLAKARLAF